MAAHPACPVLRVLVAGIRIMPEFFHNEILQCEAWIHHLGVEVHWSELLCYFLRNPEGISHLWMKIRRLQALHSLSVRGPKPLSEVGAPAAVEGGEHLERLTPAAPIHEIFQIITEHTVMRCLEAKSQRMGSLSQQLVPLKGIGGIVCMYADLLNGMQLCQPSEDLLRLPVQEMELLALLRIFLPEAGNMLEEIAAAMLQITLIP